MCASRNRSQFVLRVEDDLARGPCLRPIIDDQLQNDVKSRLHGAVGQVLPLAGPGSSVARHAGAWVGPVASKPRSQIVLTRVKTVVLSRYE